MVENFPAWCIFVIDHDSNQIRFGFTQPKEVISSSTWLIPHIDYKWTVENIHSRVIQLLRKRAQVRKVSRAFKIENPPSLLCLIVVLITDLV